MIGRTLSHYRIERMLGAGGMGEVYLALDERLRRHVAIKLLPAATSAQEDARRPLRHEASTLVRLSHPRIATVLDFDTADGVDFLVMEYVVGTTLEVRLQRGPLPVAEALDYAAQVVEALEEAHEHGIVHRDLKPANIMVTPKGQVKVMDFGLAKLLYAGPDSTDTRSVGETRSTEHLVKGTYPYMAPEQLLAGRVDGRTDLHAVGVVLYEMLTGGRPYHGQTMHSLVNAIVNTPPPSPARVVKGLPTRVERIVLRCLEKDPDRRFASATELLDELRAASVRPGGFEFGWPAPMRWGVSSALVLLVGLLLTLDVGGIRTHTLERFSHGRIHAVLVLPLANLSSDPQHAFLADGLTDALIAQFTQQGSFDVISRTSAMRYKGSRATLRQIGRELHVDAVVEGSLMPVGDRVRITAELVRASDDRQLWAQSYERGLDDPLGLQTEMASTIAADVRRRVLPQVTAASLTARAKPAAEPAVSAEAQDAYLKGTYYAGKSSEAMLRVSLKFFEQAISLAPNHAAAHAGLAKSRALLGVAGAADAAGLFSEAETSARRALELDAAQADAEVALGLARLYGAWDWNGAHEAFARAVKLQPGSSVTHHWYAVLLSCEGRHDEAVAEAQRAESLDPLTLAMRLDVGMRLYYARRPEAAVTQLQRALELEPGSPTTRYWLGLALSQANRPREALEQLRGVEGPEALAPLGVAYASLGNLAQARKLLADLNSIVGSGSEWVSPLDLAGLCARLGLKDQAFAWLERAYKEHAPPLTSLKVDPLLDPLRRDPRFDALLRRVVVPS